jgi:hypothetical protein
MAKKIHYQDNLFYLITLIKNLREGFSLDIDPEYFTDKVIEDVFFIDSCLKRIYSALKSNSYLVNRPDYLKNLLRAKKAFNDFLEQIINSKFAFCVHIEPFFAKFKSSMVEHIRDMTEISAMLEPKKQEDAGDPDVISQDEYRFLLKDDE